MKKLCADCRNALYKGIHTIIEDNRTPTTGTERTEGQDVKMTNKQGR